MHFDIFWYIIKYNTLSRPTEEYMQPSHCMHFCVVDLRKAHFNKHNIVGKVLLGEKVASSYNHDLTGVIVVL